MFALDSGDEVAAEEAFRDYAMFYEHDYDGWFYRAYPLMMLERTPEAIETLRRAYEINPQRLSAIAHLARYSMLLGNLPEAWQWQKVLADRGYGDEAHYVAAQLLMDEGKYDEAEQSFRAMLSSSNKFYRSIADSLLARYFAERGDLKRALELTDVGLTLDRENGISGLEAMKHVDRALLLCELKRTREIGPEIANARTLMPSPELVIAASDALGRCGTENKGARNVVVAALHELSTKLVAEPNNVNATVAAFRVKGEELLASGRAKAAVIEFLKAHQMEAPAVRPQYLARGDVAAAAQESNPALAKTYRDNAREIDHDIAEHQGDAWNSLQTLAPGFYCASLRSYLTDADTWTADHDEEKQKTLRMYLSLCGREDVSGPDRGPNRRFPLP
jgi:tetratricopeptide (TPR) repeat protein